MELVLKQLRKRYVSDENLPIQLIHSPYFEDRLELCERDYSAKTNYDSLLKLIDDRFDGNPNKFLEEYAKVRDDIITTVTNSEAYKEFNGDKKFIKNISPICTNRNLYTNEQDGGLFISYDMKKANFQTLKYANPSIVYDADTYEDFIGKFTDLDYIKKSKYTRQVIFGKMNPSRTIGLEKWITNEFAKFMVTSSELKEYVEIGKVTPFSLNNDEIIFKFDGSEEEFEKLTLFNSVIWDGVEFKLDKFKLHARHFKLATSSSLLIVYEKEDYLNAHRRGLKGVPATYFPQVYKLLNGMEINDSDLKFYYENQICSFDNPIQLIKSEIIYGNN